MCYPLASQQIQNDEPAAAMLNKPEPQPEKREAVVIKKYANRRLYNTETSTYVTLEDLAAMVRSDRDFVVYDAKTGDDLTHSVLTQIIVEQEGRAGGQTLLPVPFLRQLIRFYDDSIGKMVPSYLQFSLETLAKEQERFRAQFAHMFGKNPFGAAAFEAMQEQTRRNMAIFEQAMAMWSPFSPPRPNSEQAQGEPAANARAAPEGDGKPSTSAGIDEIAELKAELGRMQAKIERLSQNRESRG
jgi:polyhydroxyalkanoate synthesis repressor PhaR